MRITIMTMFPEMFNDFLNGPLVKRAIAKELARIEIEDIRPYAEGSYRHLDDAPFGGGAGMIMRVAPVDKALKAIRGENSHVAVCAPVGKTYTQRKARQLLTYEHLIIISGHYEGLDARIYESADELISIGDYVLSGGELAAMVITDSLIRLLPGVIREGAASDESFENGLLEYPQYTQPAVYEGKAVPEVLLSGNHEKIRKWRLEQSLRLTYELRKDLLADREFTKEEEEILSRIKEER